MEFPALHIQGLRLICCCSIFQIHFPLTQAGTLGKHGLLFFIPGSSCFLYKFPSDSFNEIPLTIELISPSAPPLLICPARLYLLLSALCCYQPLENAVTTSTYSICNFRKQNIFMPPLKTAALNGSNQFCPLPFITRNIFAWKLRYPVPQWEPNLSLSFHATFQALKKIRVCLTLGTYPQHKRLFQEF